MPIYKPSSKKSAKIIGFASHWFWGNVKYLYEEMKKCNGIEVYFVTPNKKELERLKSSDVNAYNDKDIRRVSLFLRTDVWVTDNNYRQIPLAGLIMDRVCRRFFGLPFKRKHGSKWVDVWHAVGVKYVGREKTLIDYDLGFVTSEFFKQYHLKKAKILGKLKITGDPRTDPLIKKNWDRKKILDEMNIPCNKKNILYAPTWGHEKKKAFLPWGKIDENVEGIEKFCSENNCSFLIRMHPQWWCWRNPEKRKELEEKIKQSNNIFDLSVEKYPDVQRILYVSDLLITDWSSIANDFILLDRPIIFLDVETPVEELIVKPEERPGYIVRSKKELFEKVQESMNQPKSFAEKRKTLIKKIYKHLDGNSSKRCAEEIMKLLENPL